ncbi:hypothetical protein ABZ638_25925 [Streptomyces sp. NPDC007107]|uniref:hypothetical protein n=1 Tax=Streptomyces sp. NPDC007107 TaxID=3156915 RepID=UPI0033C08EA9
MSGPRGAGRLGRTTGRTRAGGITAVPGLAAGPPTALAAPGEDTSVDSVDPTAGPAGSHDIVPVTGTPTGSAVTHDTRPALSTSVPGTITGAVPVSTDHSAEPAASAPGGALGSVTSLALTGSGTDRLRIRSVEATVACRPQLVLTFGVE